MYIYITVYTYTYCNFSMYMYVYIHVCMYTLCRTQELKQLSRLSRLKTVFVMCKWVQFILLFLWTKISMYYIHWCTYYVLMCACIVICIVHVCIMMVLIGQVCISFPQFPPQFHDHYFAACFDSGSLQVRRIVLHVRIYIYT